jgi:hypothetical protein
MARVAWALAAAVLTSAGAAGAQPEPSDTPPPGFYTEPPEPPAESAPADPAPAVAPRPAPAAKRPAGPSIYEPPVPGAPVPVVYEPPPPPRPKHVAPKTALWAGVRLGWFVPFGSAWARCTYVSSTGNCVVAESVPWSDYASSGPLFELDLGARLGRNYNLFILWEHAGLGGGADDPSLLPTPAPSPAASTSASTDYYALGLRFSSDPDHTGFLTEFALGWRRFDAKWEDGTELRLTDAPWEFRLGLGADIRLGKSLSIEPLATLGFGVFGSAEWQLADGTHVDALQGLDQPDAHSWVTLQIGGHFDLGR